MQRQRSVGIVLFDGIEVLDFAGPFEVFSLAGSDGPGAPAFSVFTVAERTPVTAGGGLVVVPSFTFETAPTPDILIVPGGSFVRPDGTHVGRRHEMHNRVMLDYLRRVDATTELTISVCTGAMILANAGLLQGLSVTTHHGAYDELRALVPDGRVLEGVKHVDTGHIVTSGGISAGIDMSLSVVARLLGDELARATAEGMEYDWLPRSRPTAT